MARPETGLDTRPMATPAAGADRSTPASIRAMDPPHTEAMDEEPLDSRTSEKIQAWSLLAPSILNGEKHGDNRRANKNDSSSPHLSTWHL